MVENNKHMKRSYDEVSTSEDTSCESVDYNLNKQVINKKPCNSKYAEPQKQPKKCFSRSGRQPKCSTKNALLARQNRLKKKIYIENLENNVTSLQKENKKLVKIVNNQSLLVADLKKQLKYFKSIVANSSDISKLIRNIHHSTGMSVSTSLDKNLSLSNARFPEPPIARKVAHPWEETSEESDSYYEPESKQLYNSIDDLSSDDISDIFNGINIPLDLPIGEEELIDNSLFKENECISNHSNIFEHNYSTAISNRADGSDTDNVGICVHVSKHRLSLEFCSTCSENATQSWNN